MKLKNVCVCICLTAGVLLAEELSVVSATPNGELENQSQSTSIQVAFNMPMVALSTLPEGNGSGPIKITPPVEGRYRWKGTDVLVFTPDKPFTLATEYKVTIPAGTKSQIKNAVLSKDYDWTFQTVRPRVVELFPQPRTENNENYYDPMLLNQPIYIQFYLPVKPEKFQQFLSVEPSVEISCSNPTDTTLFNQSEYDQGGFKKDRTRTDVIKIVPKNGWKKNTLYHFTIKAGLTSTIGNIGMAQDYTFDQETYGPLEFKEFSVNGDAIANGASISPEQSLMIVFNNAITLKDFIPHIHFTPNVQISDEVKESTYESRRFDVNFNLAASKSYTVTIDSDLKDIYGTKLGEKVTFNFSTKAYKPYIKMVEGNGIVELNGKHRIPLDLVNAKNIPFYLKQITSEKIVNLLKSPNLFSSSTRPDFSSSGGWTYTTSIGKDIPLNKRTRLPLYLDTALDKGSGVVYAVIENKYQSEVSYQKALLQVTNLGITAKFGYDNTSIIISSLDQGAKLSNVNVEIRDTFNTVLWSGTTGNEGMITAPSWKSLGIKTSSSWSMPKLYVIAKKDNDWAFTSSEWSSDISPYRFNINYSSTTVPPLLYSGTIITDRDLYRPGETVYCKGIVRFLENGAWSSVKHQKIELVVEGTYYGHTSTSEEGEGEGEGDGEGDGSTNITLYSETLNLFKPGSFECKFKIPEDAKLMSCSIKAHVVGFEDGENQNKDDHQSITGQFRIAEFRPAELEVNVRTDKDNYTFGEKADINVSANYLHGAPVQKGPFKWVVRRSPFYFSAEGFDGYSFYSGNEDKFDSYEESESTENSNLIQSDSGETDKQGNAKVRLSLDRDNFSGSAQYEFQATVEGKSPQPVSFRKQFIVHAADFYIGLKPSTSFGEEGKPIQINVVSVNHNSERVSEKSIKLTVIRRVWQSIRKAGVDGRWSWESEKSDSICKEANISTHNTQAGDAVDFTPDKSGYYIIKAASKDSHGNEITSITSIYVTGKSYSPWMREDNDILELIADKKNYSPGENARILVKSPYKQSTAIVTVEREGIIDSRWVTLDGTADKIIIPIKNEYLPNVFVSVIIIRGRTTPLKFDDAGDDLSKPSFKIGYINLHVNPQSKHLAIDMLPDQKQYQPGDSVHVKVKIPKLSGKAYGSEVLVMAVDEGVLLLSGYKTPDPFNYFFKDHPLSVITSESRSSVIGERDYGEKGKNRGGGGGFSAAILAQLADVKSRGNFKTCAYFNPRVKVDKNGEAAVSFKLPDNLTTFRVMAVANTEMSEFGGNDIKIRVNKKIMIRPILPRFVRMNDSLFAGVVAENYSTLKDTFFIKVDAENITIPGSSTMKVVIPENGQTEIKFPIIASANKDTAKLTFKGVLGQYSDGVVAKLPIVLDRSMETVALTGSTLDSAVQEVDLPDSTFSGVGKVTTGLSSTALIGLNEGVSYLFDYPYGCLEQQTSKILPLLLFEDMVKSFNIKTLKNNDSHEIIQNYFNSLNKYQTSDGGFDYWTPALHSSPYLSAYALLAIVKGEKKKFSIDPNVKNQVIDYLSSILNGNVDRKYYPYSETAWLSSQAFMVAVLAEAGKYEADDVERLYKKRNSLSFEAKCDLIKAITFGNGDKTIKADLKRIIDNSISIEAATAHFEEPLSKELLWLHESNVKTTAIALQTLVSTQGEFSQAEKIVRWLMQQQKSGRWNTTQENVWVFWALADYFKVYEKDVPDFTVQLKVDGKNWMEELFKGRSTKQIRKSSPLSEFETGKKLSMQFNKTGAGRVYYEVRMQYARKGVLDAKNEGFEVERKYFTLDDKEIKPSDFIKDKVVIVKLSVKNDKDRIFVAVNDAIPAGSEIIDPGLASTDQEIANKISSLSSTNEDYWWGSWNHTEYRDQRCLLFADYLNAGTHTFTYAIRPIVSGAFYTPPTYVEEMYSPEIFGRSVEANVKIKDKK